MWRSFLLMTLLLLGTAGSAVAEGDAAVATDARVAGDAKRTRLILDLSGTVEFRAFMLEDPDRVVVDLPQIDFSPLRETNRQGRGLVSAFRFGLIAAGRSRVVIDLGSPALIDKAFVLEPAGAQPAGLGIDLVGSDRMAFGTRIAGQFSLGTLRNDKPAPPAPPPVASSLPVIVLDPGHGGIDSGAVTAKGDQEKGIVLDFARLL